MARDEFSQDLDVRQQYLSLLYHKIPGEADWTLLHQGRAFTPNQSGDTSEYSRIGDKNKKKVAQTVVTDANITIYYQNTLEELARIMGGVIRPSEGWTGSEVIELDTTIVHDFKIVNFDGITAASNPLYTEYINGWQASSDSAPLDAEGDVRIAEFSGAASSYYILPEAGT